MAQQSGRKRHNVEGTAEEIKKTDKTVEDAKKIAEENAGFFKNLLKGLKNEKE